VKDVYLPGSGLWVSEYPHADRTALLEISLAVEREAQQEAGAPGQPWTPAGGPAYGGPGQTGEAQQRYGGSWQQDEFGVGNSMY
jgi:hypothetical protein